MTVVLATADGPQAARGLSNLSARSCSPSRATSWQPGRRVNTAEPTGVEVDPSQHEQATRGVAIRPRHAPLKTGSLFKALLG
jgi:hypothetical protein